MVYAQQYAGYAQQFAQYAQFCAQQGAVQEARKQHEAKVTELHRETQAKIAAAEKLKGKKGKRARAAVAEAERLKGSKPLMITPYRHNWYFYNILRIINRKRRWGLLRREPARVRPSSCNIYILRK